MTGRCATVHRRWCASLSRGSAHRRTLEHRCWRPSTRHRPSQMFRARPRVAHAHAARTITAPLGDGGMAPLLDLDPDLGRGLPPALYEQVRRWLVVPVWSLRRGHWAAGLEPGDDMMGFLVLDGVIARSVSLGRIAYPELLGAGDLLRPWQPHAHPGPLAVQVEWQVIEPSRVAVLDHRFGGLVCRWPEGVDEVVGRVQPRAGEVGL